MNPTILEASDDLTNLSHLNEPAGMEYKPLNLIDHHINRLLQFYRRFGYDTPKRRSTHTVV